MATNMNATFVEIGAILQFFGLALRSPWLIPAMPCIRQPLARRMNAQRVAYSDSIFASRWGSSSSTRWVQRVMRIHVILNDNITCPRISNFDWTSSLMANTIRTHHVKVVVWFCREFATFIAAASTPSGVIKLLAQPVTRCHCRVLLWCLFCAVGLLRRVSGSPKND